MPSRRPASTTSTPPERIIHSNRWSRYSRTFAPERKAEALTDLDRPVSVEELRLTNHWTRQQLERLVKLGCASGLVDWVRGSPEMHLNAAGKLEARRVTRNHRLWETYLLQYADVAAQHIHHNADQIEHVIDPMIVNELEELLSGKSVAQLVPRNPEK